MIMLKRLGEKHIEEQKRIEILETDLHRYSQLIFGKAVRSEERSFFQQMVLEPLDILRELMNLSSSMKIN